MINLKTEWNEIEVHNIPKKYNIVSNGGELLDSIYIISTVDKPVKIVIEDEWCVTENEGELEITRKIETSEFIKILMNEVERLSKKIVELEKS